LFVLGLRSRGLLEAWSCTMKLAQSCGAACEDARLLRKEDNTGAAVALGAHAMAQDRARCLDAGCDRYASKPIDRQELLAIVQTSLQPAVAEAGTPREHKGDPAFSGATNRPVTADTAREAADV
jgi:DNA-binding response OmpR family regulator